nr:MAG TPA: hypothetical protein [Caudoviricetes sp.]
MDFAPSLIFITMIGRGRLRKPTTTALLWGSAWNAPAASAISSKQQLHHEPAQSGRVF